MPSLFPGMNPYLEAPSVWHDFHKCFFPAARELLASQLRPLSIARIGERVCPYDTRAEERRDLAWAGHYSQSRSPAGGVLESESLSYLAIPDRTSREIITVVELLSPSNKQPGPDRDQYLARRRQLLDSPAQLVEIDLLRGGRRLPWDDLPASDYCAVVSRAGRRPRAGAWPIGLRQPLPVLPIPLRPGDPDARLDLQALLHRIYDAAGYEDYVYATPPDPPLAPADAAWAADLVRGHAP